MIRVNTSKFGLVEMKFYHNRPENSIIKKQVGNTVKKISTQDTFTECTLDFLDQNVKFFGRAIVHPMDQFNKSIGRELALVRCLNEVDGLDNVTRNELMTGYANRNSQPQDCPDCMYPNNDHKSLVDTVKTS